MKIQQRKEKSECEQKLWKLYKNLNREYFHNSIHINRVRRGAFLSDAFNCRITYGLYEYDTRKGTNQITVNKHLLTYIIEKFYPWLPEVIVYHEMVHAHIYLNTHPVRKLKRGEVVCKAHGAEFWKLMLKHPNAARAEKIMKIIEEQIKREIMMEAANYFCGKPERAEKYGSVEEVAKKLGIPTRFIYGGPLHLSA